MRPSKALAALLAAVLLAGGCAGSLISEERAPVDYRIDYASPHVAVSAGFNRGLRVWRFSAARPYDGRNMVVLSGDGQASSSSRFRWIAPPGSLLADRLARDLEAGGLFPHVVAAAAPDPAPLELSGHVDTFAWQQQRDKGRAVLELRLTLSDAGKKVLFQKRYHLESEPADAYSPGAFAAAMSGLVREASGRLQRDLADLAHHG